MVISADTSFLFSLYGNDSHTPKTVTWSAGNTDPILISAFNRFELINALRFAECRKQLPSGSAMTYQNLFINAISAGRLIEPNLNLSNILAEAHRLSSVHTLRHGHRAFDILHVAAAKVMKASHFLTFDANQKRLAESEGLIVPI
jgi:predicted nucleic acid-binding protein